MSKLILPTLFLLALMTTPVLTTAADQASTNPLLAPSTLPYQTIPFDKLKDGDYQPAIEAGMAEQLKEIDAIANNPAPPTLDNTIVAMEKSGELLQRATSAFFAQAGANTNPTLEKVRSVIAPKLAAHRDAIFLNPKLFQRVSALYKQRDSLKLDPESLRLVEYTYKEFVHAGANLNDADKEQLKKLNEQIASLSEGFSTKLLAATKDSAFVTMDRAPLAGLTEADITAAAEAAKARKVEGYVIPLQNTTQQPDLVSLTKRTTRETIFKNSWERAERSNANDTRETISKIAQLRAQKGKLLGFPNFAAWKIEDQMARTPEAALEFMGKIAPAATAR